MSKYKIWMIVGTQSLYGDDIFKTIENNSRLIEENLKLKIEGLCDFEFKKIVKNSDEIENIIRDANYDSNVIGIVTWTHTFSPSKMWIRGLNILQKPLLQLDTQFNREIPWETIDMDYMNLHQSAHGDKEHGYIYARMNIKHQVISGDFRSENFINQLENWIRSAIGYMESKSLNVIRFGDNMRHVAVTEGDKVEAQIRFGWNINTIAVSALETEINKISKSEVTDLFNEYITKYDLSTKQIESVYYQARMEIAIKKILKKHKAFAFSNTFEDTANIKQLAGLSAQNLMAQGIGFAAEGDWKTAALLRIIKMMSVNSNKGCSFMEDYTYHFSSEGNYVLGSHMLEVDPSISDDKPRIEVHPLSIGGKEAPARLVFDAKKGKALQVCLIDLGHRFRMIIQDVNTIKPLKEMPNLPVARAMWQLEPNFEIGAKAWIIAGGSHHTVLTYDISPEVFKNWSEMMNIECLHINQDTSIEQLKQQIKINESYYKNI